VLHDNFCAVQATAKLLHARHCPSALLKIDIAKTFDMVGWAFLLELLSHLGFSRRWRDWMSTFLSDSEHKNPFEQLPWAPHFPC
jgi:hypothetical protein